ncbi:YhcN/YlaJ family sporulation lipoprotein [Lentibacillus lipolyticus]|nr:YhcN/YlaJ family sporulation lipoprotein [Lentibacillus lipolyticus]
MKWKLLSILFAAIFILGACQADNGNDDEQNNQDGDDNNVEQTRFDDDADTDNMNNRNDNEFNNGNRTRDTDNPGNDINNNNGEDQYELADKAADQITEKVDGIDNAYVIKTDNNAYVAAELDRDNNMNNNNNGDRGDEITDKVKQEISRIVKSVDSDVDNVYVSTNPDFFDLAGNYADDADNGEPVEGLFDQIGNTIERVFPQNKD